MKTLSLVQMAHLIDLGLPKPPTEAAIRNIVIEEAYARQVGAPSCEICESVRRDLGIE